MKTLRRYAPLLLWLLAAWGGWGCAGPRDPNTVFRERFDIGPDQQGLIDSLAGEGAALPGGCALARTTVQRTSFQAVYQCPGAAGPATIEFRHREVAPRGSVVTGQFALIPFGVHGVPPALLAAVTGRVRAGESAWRWVSPDGTVATPPPPVAPPPVAPPPVAPPPVVPPPVVPPPVADVPPAPPPDAAPDRPVTAAPAAPSSDDAGAVLAAPDPLPPPSAPPPSAPPPRDLFEATGPPDLFGVLSDGVVLYLGGLAFILLVVRRQLADAPRWAGPALAVVVLGGAALRLAVSPVAPLNAWSYARVIPLARHAYEGFVLPAVSRATGATFHLTAVNFSAGLAIAAAAPLVLFAHARYVLKDWRSALAAAAILAVLPLHLRFSHSDVEILQTLLTSSFTFVVLYCALSDPSPRWRRACFVALPLLCLATYYARPEAIIFFPLDLGGVAIAWAAAPRARRSLAAALMSAAAALAVSTHLLVHYRQNLDDGLSLRTLQIAREMLTDANFNMLLNPWSSPPGLGLLAVLGAGYLWRQGERGRCVFLLGWLSVFFVVHSYVFPTGPATQARYHLNLVTPFVLLAAAATPLVLRAPRWAAAAVALYLLASPALHRRFVRDTDYFEMREFAFLESVRDRIPDRCTVLEFRPAVSSTMPEVIHASRLSRVGARISGGRSRSSWRVVSLGVLPPPRPGREPAEVLSPEARAVLRERPPCLMVYLGLTCFSHRPLSARVAPVCQEVRAALDLEPVAETRFRSHVYDSVSIGRVIMNAYGVTHTVRALRGAVELGLYRVRGDR